MKKLYLFWMLFLGVLISGFAQTYPFRVSVMLKQPLAPDWTYFLDDIQQPLTVNIVFNDFAEASLDYKLRLKIENLNTGESAVSYVTGLQHARTAIPGVLETFSGSDLLPYFETLKGTLSSKPSDGNYRFCVEVLDVESNRVLSNAGCAIGFIQTLRNPVAVTPELGKEIENSEFLNIPFQWQLMNGVNPILANNIEYVFKLYEINDTYKGNLLTAERNGQAQLIFTSDPLTQTKYDYGMINADPPLRQGARYLWRVQAYHIDEIPIFEGKGTEQGLSAPSLFEVISPEREKAEEDSTEAEEDAVVLALRVKDKITDELVEGAKVTLISTEDGIEISQETNIQGQFMRNDIVPNTYQVKIEARGYEPLEDELFIERDLRNLFMNLVPLSSKITGTITDIFSGEGLENAHIELRRVKADGSDESVASISSTTEGEFEFAEVLGGGEYFLNVEKTLYEYYRGKPFRIKADSEKKLRPVRIGNKVMGIMYGSIKGKITRTQKALSNAEVYALTYEEFTDYLRDGEIPETTLKTTTSSTGTYEIKEVPAQLKGKKPYLLLLPDGELYKEGFGEFEIHEQDQKAQVDLDVESQPVRVSGTITDEGGEPVIGATIELYKLDNQTIHKTTKSDGEGRYFIDGIEMKPQGYGKILVSSSAFRPTTHTDIFKGDLAREYVADAVLKFNNAVKGIITNQFDKPVQGVTIQIDGKTTTTDAEGKFSLEDLGSERQKTAYFSVNGMEYEEIFTLPNSGDFQLKLEVLDFVKRLTFNVIDSKGKTAENVEFKILLAEINSKKDGEELIQTTFERGSQQIIDIKLPEGFAGKKLLFLARNEIGVSKFVPFDLPESLEDITPDDMFFTRSQSVTIHLQSAVAKITTIVKDDSGNPIGGATVEMKGTKEKGVTDDNGELVLENLPIREKYALVVSATPDYIKQDAQIVNNQDRLKRKQEFQLKAKLEANNLKDIKELFGFKVLIEDVKTSEGSNVVRLNGKFKIPAKQAVTPAEIQIEGIGEQAFYAIEFRNLEYDVVKRQPLKESIALSRTFPILIDKTLQATLTKPVLKEGKILAKSANLIDIKTNMLQLKRLGIAVAPLVIYNKASANIPDIKITTIARKPIQGYKINLEGGYSFKVTGMSLGKNSKDATKKGDTKKVKAYWRLDIKGGFHFPSADAYKDTNANIAITGFSPKKSSFRSHLSGQVTFEKGFIFVIGNLAYNSKEKGLRGRKAEAALKSGLGFYIMFGATDLKIDKKGFLQDCELDIPTAKKPKKPKDKTKASFKKLVQELKAQRRKEALAATAVATVAPPPLKRQNQLTKADFGKLDKAKATEKIHKETSWGGITITGATIGSKGRDLKINIKGSLGLSMFGGGGFNLKEFEYTSSPSVKLIIQKGKAKGKEDKEKKPDEKSGALAKLSFEVQAIEANIDLGDPVNSYLTIKGKAGLEVPSFKVEVGRLTVGGNRWGGEFGVTATNPTWAARGQVILDITNTEKDGLSVEYEVRGLLWIGEEEEGGGGGTRTVIEVDFVFANTKERLEISIQASRDSKAAGPFDIVKLGGRVIYEKEKGRWTIGASAAFIIYDILLDIEWLQVKFGGGESFILHLEKVTVSDKKKIYSGIGEDLIIDFGKRTFTGRVKAIVKMEGHKFEVASAYWTLDFKYHKYGLGLRGPFPLFGLPVRETVLAFGNDVRGVMKMMNVGQGNSRCSAESTSITEGFYLILSNHASWRGSFTLIPAVSIDVQAGYRIQAAVGVQIVPPMYAQLKFAAYAYLNAQLRIMGIETASIEARACLYARFNVGFYPSFYTEGEAEASVYVRGCVRIGTGRLSYEKCKSGSFRLRATKPKNGGIRFSRN